MHRSMFALAIALALTILAPAAALGQETAEPAEGDLVWTFASEDPFFDERVRLSLILQMDIEAELAATSADVLLLPASADDREFAAQPGIEADAAILLAAAGMDFAQIDVIGSCAVWVAPPPVEGSPISLEQREAAASALGHAFQATIEGLGAPVGECALTADPSAAQLFVWGFDETAPANPMRSASTLFAPPDLPGAGPGGTGGGESPSPPSAGSGGLARGGETALLDAVMLVAIAVAMPFAVRSLITREPR